MTAHLSIYLPLLLAIAGAIVYLTAPDAGRGPRFGRLGFWVSIMGLGAWLLAGAGIIRFP